MVRTLVLHAGTPKTGTTSLQIYLDRQREALMRRGILYPRIDGSARPAKPKHQWLVNMLLAADGNALIEKIDQVLGEPDASIHTVILSTEGLFHHWWDFSTAARAALAALAERTTLRVFVWFREPVAFVRANYIQMLKNPRGSLVSCYGRDVSVDEILEDRWFSRHLDYMGYIRDVEALLGRGTVTPFAYRGDTIAAFLRGVGVTDMEPAHLSAHRSIGSFGVDVLRGVNRRGLAADCKADAVALIERLDAILGPLSQPLPISAATARRIRERAADSVDWLEREFGIAFDVPATE